MGSKARPEGWKSTALFNRAALLRASLPNGGAVLTVKLNWPRTTSAAGAFAPEFSAATGYRSTRLFRVSENHRLPSLSNTRAVRDNTSLTAMAMDFSEMPPAFGAFVLNAVWPITMSGVLTSSLLAVGFGYRNMRLFPASATNKFPFESTATATGLFRPVERDVPGPRPLVEYLSSWPIMMSAGCPLENMDAFFQHITRLLEVSAT